MINTLLLVFIVTYIYEFTPFIFEFTKWLWEYLRNSKYKGEGLRKPFSCRFCMCFHISWITLLISGYPILVSLALACVISVINNLIVKKIKEYERNL